MYSPGMRTRAQKTSTDLTEEEVKRAMGALYGLHSFLWRKEKKRRKRR
jgi:hypothetical protein